MTHHPDPAPRWRTSSHSGSGNDCVQVAAGASGGVAVRDSKNPRGPALTFTASAWETLTRAIKASASA